MKGKMKGLRRVWLVLMALCLLIQLAPSVPAQAETAKSNIQISLTAYAGSGAESITSIASGGVFRVETVVNVQPSESALHYNNAVIEIPIPNGVTVSKSSVIAPTTLVQNWSLVTRPGGGVSLVLTLQDTLEPGQAYIITFSGAFPNLTTADGTTAAFTAKLTGNVLEGDTPTAFEQTSNTMSVSAVASDAWAVTKSVSSQGSETPSDSDTYYYVTYKIDAHLNNGSDAANLYDRTGRLELDKFYITDTLPTANVPAGGEPVFVSMTADGMTLTSGTDYSLTQTGGKLTSVTLNRHNVLSADGSNVPAGTSANTVYYLTVKYLRSAYETASNIQSVVMRTLTNSALLTYSLNTEADDRTSQDTADVELGWRENATNPVSLTVLKKLQIGSSVFTLTSGKQTSYGTASFTLYTDEACTQLATDIDGTTLSNQAVRTTDANGEAKFENLRFGTYYLLETAVPGSFTSPIAKSGTDVSKKLKVVIASTGAVTLPDTVSGVTYNTSTKKLEVLNTAETGTIGIVTFVKTGVDAGGTTVTKLPGAEFTISGTKTAGGTYTATAVSDANGVVTFEAVPAGIYTVSETGLSEVLLAEGYAVSTVTGTVTVAGNDVVSPNFGTTAAPVYSLENQSASGKLTIVKKGQSMVNGEAVTTAITGGTYALYGPSATKPGTGATPVAGYESFTITDAAGYTTGPLAAGTYWIQEITAPAGYALPADPWTQVSVAARSIASVDIVNQAKGQLNIYKTGSLGSANIGYLNGIQFNIYTTETGGTSIGTLSSVVDATGAAAYKTDNVYNAASITLDPGTYWLEEVASSVPEGYTPLTGRTQVTVTAGVVDDDAVVRIDNAASWGRIHISKADSTDSTKKLAGVVFEIYDNAACTGTPVDTITTNTTGDAYSKLLNTAKQYYIKEISTASGYTVWTAGHIINGVDGDGNAIFTGTGISVIGTQQLDITAVNDPQVSLTVTKTDADDAAIKISGVKFELYPRISGNTAAQDRAQAAANNGILTATTGSNGVASFNGLAAGQTYWLTELSAPTGYIVDNTPQTVTTNAVATSLSTNVNRTNSLKAKVKVFKSGTYDDIKAGLSGVKIEMWPRLTSDAADDYADAGTADIRTATTVSNGIATFDDVVPGVYWVREQSGQTVSGYDLNTTAYSITVLSGDFSGVTGYRARVNGNLYHTEIVNTPNRGYVKIKKTDDAGSTTGLTAAFTLTPWTTGDSTGAEDTTRTTITLTTANGTITSGYVLPGYYKVVETSVTGPATYKYQLDTTVRYIQVAAGQTNTVLFDNPVVNQRYGSLQITKYALWTLNDTTDTGLRTTLAGAVFEVYPKTSATSTAAADRAAAVTAGTLLENLTANANGVVTVNDLLPGDYWYFETSSPTGYTNKMTTALSVTVTANAQAKVEVDNTPEKGRIRLFKYEEGTTKLLDGAWFDIYVVDANGTVTTPDNATVKKYTASSTYDLESGTETGFTGTALTDQLTPGTYYLRELTGSPLLTTYGYTITNEWIGPITVEAGKVTTADAYNTPPEVDVSKIDQNGNPLEGAGIALFDTQAHAEAAEAAITGDATTAAAVQAMPGWVASATSNEEGNLIFTGLTAGTTYYAIEYAAPTGYIRSTEIKTVMYWSSGTTSGFTPVLQFANIAYGHLRIRKYTTLTGTDTVYPVNGVTFTIYKAVLKTGGDATADTTGNHVVGTSCEYEKGDVVTTLTTGTETGISGTALSGMLVPGHYIVEETAVPENSALTMDTNAYHIIVQAGQTNTYLYDGLNDGKGVYNQSGLGKFQIKKVSSVSAATTLSATYGLYTVSGSEGAYVYTPVKDTSGKNVTITTNATTGLYESDMLAPGTYAIQEISVAQKGSYKYTVDSAYHHITVTAGSINTANVATPLTNVPMGSLRVLKKGQFMSDTPVNLNGVKFTLYYSTGNAAVDVAAANVVVSVGGSTAASATTNSSGIASWSYLHAGNYWLVEESVGTANAAYALNTTVWPVTIAAGTQNNIYYSNPIINTAAYGKLQVKKISGQDAAAIKTGLSGAVFEVYGNAACTGTPVTTLTTGSDGTALSGLLAPGEYYLKEITPPANFLLPDVVISGPYTVTANHVNTAEEPIITLTNERSKSISLHKVARSRNAEDTADVDVNLSGVTFYLYKTQAQAEAKGTPYMTAKTGSNGVATFTGLSPNTTYYVIEWSIDQNAANYIPSADVIAVTTNNLDDNTVVSYGTDIVNIVKGAIQVEKRGLWSNTQGYVPILAGFNVYKAADYTAGNTGESYIVTTITTNAATGIGTSGKLEPGDYTLVEVSVADGFTIDSTKTYNVTVLAGQTNTVWTGTNAIINYAVKGRFHLQKLVKDSDPEVKVSGDVTYAFYKWDTALQDWVYNNVSNTTFVVVNGDYTSGYLEPGNYMAVETIAPTGYTLDPTPIYITITSGTTAEYKHMNAAKCSLELTKTADTAFNGGRVLAGAKFQLYKDAVADGNKVGTPLTTDSNGKILWTGLDAGNYVVVETEAPDGYTLDTTEHNVTIASVGVAAKVTLEVSDTSDAGKVYIRKVDDGTGVGLSGAEFQIWTVGENDVLVSKATTANLTTLNTGWVISGLLPAVAEGTRYAVVEVKAPSGYLLDARLNAVTQFVTVYPIHNPTAAANETNTVIFRDTADKDLKGFPDKITKSVGTTVPSTPESLLSNDLKVTFQLRDYTNGTNPLKMDSFIVTDSNIVLQYKDSNNLYQAETAAAGDYTILSVSVYKAWNEAGGTVTVDVYYQTFAQLGTDTWTKANTASLRLDDLADDGYLSVPLAGRNACAIQVRYTGVEKNFNANGIDLQVQFNKRTGDAAKHEIRRVENQGKLTYTYTKLDNTAVTKEISVTQNTNIVSVDIPTQLDDLVPVSITNVAVDGSMVFSTGSTVEFVVTAKNDDTTYTKTLEQPIISFTIPGYMQLKGDAYGTDTPLKVTDSTGTPVTGYTLQSETVDYTYWNGTSWEVLQDGNGNPVQTTRITLAFPNGEIPSGDSIVIHYKGTVDNEKPAAVTSLDTPAYLSSAYRLPASLENPLGLSFTNSTTASNLVTNGSLDTLVDTLLDFDLGENRYVTATATIQVTNNNSQAIDKRVKGMLDTTFYSPGTTATTYPDGFVWYKITFRNGSVAATSVRIVDILPFKGDSYIVTNGSRSTTLTRKAILVNVEAEGATVYYMLDYDYSTRTSAEAEFPALYTSDTDRWSGWVTSVSAEDMSRVTAIGIERNYDATAPLAANGSYTVNVTVKMPGYTAEEISEFYGKQIANSAAGNAVLSGSTDPRETMVVENNQVLAKMALPTGSIGDYMFLDNNNNGIQDDGDTALANQTVKLYQTITKADGTVSRNTLTTTTDANGYYRFDELQCNALIPGREAGSTDPADYIGGLYTTYYVQFPSQGENIVPTLRYAGTDPEKDSNINALLQSETLTLTVTTDTEGKLVGEENMSIDAGYVQRAQLGDYVWLDTDKDGYQDDTETGINGVTVNLYRVADGSTVFYDKTTTADKDGKPGYYLFNSLVPGTYIVEFDITTLVKDDGYTYKYMFTTGDVDNNVSDTADSDAVTKVDADDRIRRTAEITLEAGDNDLTWDAGLTVYSALGGYAFDDANYNDVQDLNLPLIGTHVILYRVTNGICETLPLAETDVDENGTYYFDMLDAGDYQVYFDFPVDYAAVQPDAGSDDTLDSDVSVELSADRNTGFTAVIQLASDELQLHWDGGARKYGKLGDYVWVDTDADGLQDAGEVGLAGVRVILQQCNTTDDIWYNYGQTTTDADGYYAFTDLPGGVYAEVNYRVIFERPIGYKFTKVDIGEDDAVDSDALTHMVGTLGNPTGTISLGYGDTDLTWDAGVTPVIGSIGDYVWFDRNHDGIQDENEAGLPDILVVLEENLTGDLTNESAWTEKERMLTDSTGHYRFDNLSEGYFRVRYKLEGKIRNTLLESGDNGEADSDGFYFSENGWYTTRSIYLSSEAYDMSWDMGVYYGEYPPTGDTSRSLLWLTLTGLSAALLVLISCWWTSRRRVWGMNSQG